MRNCYIVGASESSSPSLLRNGLLSGLICDALGTAADDDIVIASKMHRDSTEVNQGQCVVIDSVDDELVFGKVEFFVCRADDDCWNVVVLRLEAIGYVEHFHSYAVRETMSSSYCIMQLHNLLDRHAICKVNKQLENRRVTLLRLPYWIA